MKNLTTRLNKIIGKLLDLCERPDLPFEIKLPLFEASFELIKVRDAKSA